MAPFHAYRRSYHTDTVRRQFRRVSAVYDFWAGLTEGKAARLVVEQAAVKDGDGVLEAAVGTGKLFLELLRRNPGGHTRGIDLTPEMVERTRNRLASMDFPRETDVKVEAGSALSLTYADRTFDCIVSTYMLDLLPVSAWKDVFSEFHRVARPGARVVLASFSFGWKWYHGFWRWLARVAPGLLTGCRPVELAPALKDAGFTVDEQIPVSQNTFPSEVIRARV